MDDRDDGRPPRQHTDSRHKAYHPSGTIIQVKYSVRRDGRLTRPGQTGGQPPFKQWQRRKSNASCRGGLAERLSELCAVHHPDAQSGSEGFQEVYVYSLCLCFWLCIPMLTWFRPACLSDLQHNRSQYSIPSWLFDCSAGCARIPTVKS